MPDQLNTEGAVVVGWDYGPEDDEFCAVVGHIEEGTLVIDHVAHDIGAERFAHSTVNYVRRGSAEIRVTPAQFFNELLREVYDDLAEAEHSTNDFVERVIAGAPEHERSILRQARREPRASLAMTHYADRQSVSFADEFVSDICWMCEYAPDETAVGLCMGCLEVVRARA